MSLYNPRRQGKRDGRNGEPMRQHRSAWNQREYDAGYHEGQSEAKVEKAARDSRASGPATGHTPGPWVLEDHGYTFIVSKPGNGYITRDVCRMDASTMAAFEQRANARLIAVAPMLYEALEEIATSYPKTEEGAILAGIARRAINEYKGN